MNEGGSATLVFYSVKDWWREPALNVIAAAVQMSKFTHVEIAIGEEPGDRGQMTNVCRIFNDAAGVELVQRTGRNPSYTYLQLGCTKQAETAMLIYAKSCVGRPFSNIGMARSVIFPRTTTGNSFFCAGVILDRVLNPRLAWR